MAELLRLTDDELRKHLDLSFVASRVRQLFGAGFAMEALVVANAAFEVALEWALVRAVDEHGKASKLMTDKGHSYRLELLKKMVAAKTEAGLDTEEFSKFMTALVEGNSMRNSYLHQFRSGEAAISGSGQAKSQLRKFGRDFPKRSLPFLGDASRARGPDAMLRSSARLMIRAMSELARQFVHNEGLTLAYALKDSYPVGSKRLRWSEHESTAR